MGFKPISRRTVLRGLGASIALPFLDAMTPASLLRSTTAAAQATAAGAAPLRMAMFFLPNGMNLQKWRPTNEGDEWELTPTLEPLADFRKDVTLLRGLTLDGARSHGDGGGDHARSAAAYLTGAHAHKTAGADIHLGISVDQVAARAVGSQTRLPSLELGLESGATAGECDSGYSCAYVSNISWRSATTPMPHEVNPADVFDRLFGSDDDRAAAENRVRRLRDRKSILDFVSQDTASLSRQLGRGDQNKLDEFTTSIREIERRIEVARTQSAAPTDPGMKKPQGIPHEFEEHMRLMCDLLVLAFQMDVTRIGTFMVARDGSERTFRSIGISDGHHTLSHHDGNAEKLEKLAKIDRLHIEQFAYFLKKMKSVKEGDRTLLDNSMVSFGCGIADGNRHNHDDLPMLLAGRAGGTLNPGKYVRTPRNTPLCNMYLTLLDRMGVKQDRFGDSTGMLTEI